MQLRCATLIPSSTASLFSGLAPLRYADPLGTFGGSSFKPKQLRCLGAFCLKKNLLKLAFQDFFLNKKPNSFRIGLKACGERGIRTLGTVTRTTV